MFKIGFMLTAVLAICKMLSILTISWMIVLLPVTVGILLSFVPEVFMIIVGFMLGVCAGILHWMAEQWDNLMYDKKTGNHV